MYFDILVLWMVLFEFGLIQVADAFQIFTSETVPKNLTVICSSALLNNINCSPVISSLRSGSYYPVSTLNKTCTVACQTALVQYESNVGSSCNGENWNAYEDTSMPITIIPSLLRYHFNLTCLMDTGRYCNNVAAQAAFSLDPGGNDPITGGSAGTGGNGTGSIINPCDMCFIKNLQFQAASPYFDGPQLADQSIYESKTSSCKIAGMPLTTTDLTFYTPTAPPVPTSTCTGTTYTIKPEDNCHTIAKTQGISTGWLLSDNSLQAYCNGFPTNGSLCLINKCQVYTIMANDTCESVANAFNVTEVQFKSWNPVINAGCYNLPKMLGMEFCISSPGQPYATPTITLIVPTSALTAAPVPTDAASGTTKYCGKYYQALPGNSCNIILIKFGITMDNFIFLNPAVNANCTNLQAYESYCVQPVGDINTYSGMPGASTAGPTGVQTTIKFADLPDVTTTSTNSAPTGPPLAEGTRQDCSAYFLGDVFQARSIAGTSFASTCALAAQTFYVDLTDFGTWNTDIGNTSLATCSFKIGLRYCGKLFFGQQPPGPAPTSSLPIRDGANPNCTQYAEVTDGRTCAEVLDAWHLTIAQFFSYNPAVLADCTGLWADYQYCVRAPGYTSPTPATTITTTTSTSTTKPSSPGPTLTSPVQPGQPPNCNKWYTAKAGDDCGTVERAYGLTHAQLLAWNPAVSSDCVNGFWGGYAYCVGVSDGTSAPAVTSKVGTTLSKSTASISTSKAPTTLIQSPTTTSKISIVLTKLSSTSAVSIPSPTQSGITSTCIKYAMAQPGDWCTAFADRNFVSYTNFYAWNKVLGVNGADCATKFWANTYYCVAAKVQ